ncbi:hypothetical protein NIES4074_36200 [Cylindrospermum sp. NIES-4074]|nr:hypothetical protein NIES4074_36200 [Cylindrospermum sp. NIES-4074]
MFSLTEPQVGLRRIGNSQFYATPNTPADPRDCNRFPNSPYCGGWGFSREPLDAGLEFIVDGCNLGISLSPTIGFVNFPTFQILLRGDGEACRLPKPPLPERQLEEFEEPPKAPDTGLILGYTSYSLYSSDSYRDGQTAGEESTILIEQQPVDPFREYIELGRNTVANLRLTFEYKLTEQRNGAFYQAGGFTNIQAAADTFRASGGVITGDPLSKNSKWFRERKGQFMVLMNSSTSNFQRIIAPTELQPLLLGRIIITVGRPQIGDRNYLRKQRIDRSGITRDGNDLPATVPSWFEPRNITVRETGGDFYGTYYAYTDYRLMVDGLIKTYFAVGVKFQPPPPPPRKKKECCMCCPGQNADLALLIKLQKIQLKRTGDFPAFVFDRMNTGNILQKKTPRKIESLGAMIAWLAENIDAMVGEFPIPITIEDTDVTEAGNQSSTVIIPNIAEGMAELIGLVITSKTEGAATLKAALNTLIETGSIHQGLAVSNDYLEAIIEFLAFKQKHVKKKVGLAMTPNKSNIDEILKPSEFEYKTLENGDKDDIRDLLYPLMEVAAMYRAQNFRNLGTSDPKSKLTEILDGINIGDATKKAASILKTDEEIRKAQEEGKEPPENTSKSDFDRFIEDAELGFNNALGSDDPASTNPWGRPYAERPRVRQIAKTDQGDTNG